MEKVNTLNNERKLATIARIEEIKSIEGADSIEYARVRGWWVVVRKGEFKEGDLCVYVEVDSVLPDGLPEEKREEWKALNKQMSKASEEERVALRAQMDEIVKANTRPEFEFLRSKNFRVKTIKILSKLSQGICFPISILDNVEAKVPIIENQDVTKVLGITQYVAPEPAIMGGDAKGLLKNVNILVTDEERLENLVDEYETLRKFHYVKTEKLDGCLDENTLLETEDGLMTIREICETKYDGNIKSFDIEKKQIIYTKITNHSIKSNIKNKKWFEIELENGKKLLLTENHQVWIPSLKCWKRADELTGEEELLVD